MTVQCTCTVASTGQVTFSKVPENAAMFNLATCIFGYIVYTREVVRYHIWVNQSYQQLTCPSQLYVYIYTFFRNCKTKWIIGWNHSFLRSCEMTGLLAEMVLHIILCSCKYIYYIYNIIEKTSLLADNLIFVNSFSHENIIFVIAY